MVLAVRINKMIISLDQSTFYFFKFLEDISSFFFGTTDTPVLDFWWCLPWVSKPGWIPFCVLSCLCGPQIHLWCDACWLYRGQHDSQAFLIHVIIDISARIGGGSGLEPTTICQLCKAVRGQVYFFFSRKLSSSWFVHQTDAPYLADPEVFQPSIDNSMVDRIREMCMRKSSSNSFFNFFSSGQEEMNHKLCSHLMGFHFNNSPKEVSYTNHHWTHTWATKLHDPWGVKNWRVFFNIEDLRPKWHTHAFGK